MKKFSLNIFLAKMQRLSLEESHELFKTWENEIQKLPITTANQILKHYEMRVNLYTNWKESDYLADILVFKLLSTKTPELSIDSFEEIHNLNRTNPNLQTEIINELTEEERMNLLNNFAAKLNSLVIQSLVLALTEKNQKDMMIKYKNEITKSDFKCLLLFISTLTNNNQQIFLREIKEYASSLSEEQLSLLILSVEEDYIDISNKNKADVLAAVYNNAKPIGMGIIHYDPTPMTREQSQYILDNSDILYVYAYNRDNNQDGLAQRAIATCPNVKAKQKTISF